MLIFLFKQKTAYELRISDWSSDVCSSDLNCGEGGVMAKVTYKMTGLRELETTLRQIPKAMVLRAGLNALRPGGERIAKMARAIAPVAAGNLRESFDVSTRLARALAGAQGESAPVDM